MEEGVEPAGGGIKTRRALLRASCPGPHEMLSATPPSTGVLPGCSLGAPSGVLPGCLDRLMVAPYPLPWVPLNTWAGAGAGAFLGSKDAVLGQACTLYYSIARLDPPYSVAAALQLQVPPATELLIPEIIYTRTRSVT